MKSQLVWKPVEEASCTQWLNFGNEQNNICIFIDSGFTDDGDGVEVDFENFTKR